MSESLALRAGFWERKRKRVPGSLRKKRSLGKKNRALMRALAREQEKGRAGPHPLGRKKKKKKKEHNGPSMNSRREKEKRKRRFWLRFVWARQSKKGKKSGYRKRRLAAAILPHDSEEEGKGKKSTHAFHLARRETKKEWMQKRGGSPLTYKGESPTCPPEEDQGGVEKSMAFRMEEKKKKGWMMASPHEEEKRRQELEKGLDLSQTASTTKERGKKPCKKSYSMRKKGKSSRGKGAIPPS